MKAPSTVLLVFWIAANAFAQEPPVAPTPPYQALLSGDRPKLSGAFRVRPHGDLGPETPLSRVCHKRLLDYVRLTQPQMRDWPQADACRYHKRDDHTELAVRQNATVALGYAAALAGPYERAVTGAPRDKAAADLHGLLRYLALTHTANFLPTGDGKPWGDQWQSAFWAAIAGHAAWLVWDGLDDDLRVMVARMVAHEADRFLQQPPPSGLWKDTKAEENAWNSDILALADCMFPDHPNHATWHEQAIVYMINALVREADQNDARVVDGHPAAKRITAVTIHDDYTIENHGRVHPDYLASGSLMLRNALLYQGAGLPVPDSASYNVRETFAVFKRVVAANGSCYYVNGQDWWPHRHDVPLMFAGFMNVLGNDPDAAYLEIAGLRFFARMHGRFLDGRAYDPREFNYANAEEELFCRYAELYLLHRIAGDGPSPSAPDDFVRSQSGVHHYTAGGFVTHRTTEKFASFAWRNGAMGLVYPQDRTLDNTWITAPSERGLVGRIQCEGIEDTPPALEEHRVDTTDNGFAVTARFGRCQGKVEQWLAMISLPGPAVIYLERLVAREQVTVTEVATATLAILNEDAPGIAPNQRTLYHAKGQQTLTGASQEPPRLLSLETKWLNIDNRFGVVGSRDAIAYRDNNAYERARLEEEIVANHLTDLGPVEAGQEFSRCALLVMPNQLRAATARSRLLFPAGTQNILGVKLRKTGVAANLGPDRAKAMIVDFDVELDAFETAFLEPVDLCPEPGGCDDQ